jgi:Aminotransferase class I and II
MTGWRVGWLAGPADVIDAVTRMLSSTITHVPQILQAAAVEALVNSRDQQAAKAAYGERRDRAHGALSALPGVDCPLPDGGMFVFPDMGELLAGNPNGIRTTIDLAAWLLDEAQVAVVPGEAFEAPGRLRLSFAVDGDRLDQALERLTVALRTLGRSTAARRAPSPTRGPATWSRSGSRCPLTASSCTSPPPAATARAHPSSSCTASARPRRTTSTSSTIPPSPAGRPLSSPLEDHARYAGNSEIQHPWGLAFDGETRTRTGDTTIFSRDLLALQFPRTAGDYVRSRCRIDVRVFADFASVFPCVTADGATRRPSRHEARRRPQRGRARNCHASRSWQGLILI